jgi:thiamine-monophosphate kinase
LRSISRYLDAPSSGLLVAAPGDDAAVWRGDPIVVATTDTMVEEIDFRVEWPGFDFRTLGRRLMAINLSDLAAMGAQPRHALVSLSLRGTLPVVDVTRLYRGIAEQAHRYGSTVAGGDMSGTLGPLTLTATLVGRLGSARAMLRRVGARNAGLRLLESGEQPTSRDERAWVSAQLDPTPRIAAGRALVESGIRIGGDISDGLSREVERFVEDTGLGATIDVQRLPLARGLHKKQWPLALTDSEDFELICAAPRARMRIAQRALARINVPLTVVGEIDRRSGVRYRNGNRLERLKTAGYEHFR